MTTPAPAPKRPTQVPASNSDARKRATERVELSDIWELGAEIAQRSDWEADLMRREVDER